MASRAGSQCEHRRTAIGSEREQKLALFASRAADDGERQQVDVDTSRCGHGRDSCPAGARSRRRSVLPISRDGLARAARRALRCSSAVRRTYVTEIFEDRLEPGELSSQSGPLRRRQALLPQKLPGRHRRLSPKRVCGGR